MINKVVLMGRLVRSPDLRRTQSNTAVCSFTLAIDRGRKDQNGNKQADFIPRVAWGKAGEFVNQYFDAGSMAIVVGRIQSRNWEDKNGNKRTSIEVHTNEVTFGETKKASESHHDYSSSSQNNPSQTYGDLPYNNDFSELGDLDDNDVPF